MTKLLFRRWYFSLPMLLVTLAFVAVAAVTVKPDYAAKGHIQFIPPAGTTAKDGTKNPIDNPWYDLGYEAMANAAVIDVTKKSVLEQMVKQGLSDNITVTTDQVPLFAIEVVGESPEQATATVQFVQKGIADAVQQRQETLRVPETDTITTLQLDDGGEVEEKSSKIMRVMVVAAGLGLLLTAGFTIGIDALLRWRANRRREDGDEEPTAPSLAGAGPSAGRSGGQVRPSLEKTQTVIISQPPPAAAGGKAAKPAEPQGARPGNGSNGKPSVPQQRRGTESSGTAYRSQQSAGNGSDQRGADQRGSDQRASDQRGPDPRLEQAPADATIVLPPWGWKHDDKKADRR
jgi:capsular polysaccharide biosynthesis protein